MDEEYRERKRRKEWELLYVSQYIATRYPHVPCVIHAHLGTLPQSLSGRELEPAEERMLRVRMRWADAIVFCPDESIIIEGKLRASELLKAVGELELYTHLLPLTPDYRHLIADRITAQLLTPIQDPSVETLCRRKGYQYVVWTTPLITQYLAEIPPRETRPIRPEEARYL